MPNEHPNPPQVEPSSTVAVQLVELAGRLSAVEDQAGALDRLGAVLGEHGTAIGAHGAALGGHGATLDSHGTVIDELGRRLTRLERASSTETLLTLAQRVDELERAQSVQVFTEWMDQAPPVSGVRISVILPTRDRAAYLPRAVASVLAQRHTDWELVIVDDGSTDQTPQVVAAMDDPRVRAVRLEPGAAGGGVCRARNHALALATGEVIAYLDDDNTMHPLWLKSLAWAFDRHPDVDVAYGGFVIDDVDRATGMGSGAMPKLFLRRYDRQTLLEHNLADMGAIAHRAGLPAARFDESLVEMGDWDLLCGLTAACDPLVLPAVACYYTTDAPHRLSGGPTFRADYEAVRAKHANLVSAVTQ